MTEQRAIYDAGQESPEGWGWPITSVYAHYFVDGRSLCGSWQWEGGELEPDWQSPDDCVKCLHALVKRLRLQIKQLTEAFTVLGIAPEEEQHVDNNA
jgi:hypothetical protein